MEVINRARDAITLLKLLQRELKLPSKVDHVTFVNAYAQLQTDADAFEKELQDAFMENMKAQIPKQE